MNETDETPLTGMQVRLRPSLALQRIEALKAELASTRAELEQTRDRNEALEQEVVSLKGERTRLQASLTEVSLRHKRLEEEHEALLEDTEEIKAMFDRVQKMQENYERRLERCKTKIAGLQRTLEREREASANADVTPLPPSVRPARPEPADEQEPPSLDWYRPLEL